ncbi:MAG: hypothetical protein OJI67_03270, partial [Prosthecobacter sp.]|nr:hypothetical protein [Prosthecobacter sp.]
MNKYCFNMVVEFRRIAWVLSSALLLCVPTYGQVPAAGSLGITVKNEGAGSHTQWLAPAANEVIGFDGSGQLVSKASGGAWGGITGTLSAQVDLQSALNAKAPLVSPTFTGTVTIPSGASIAGYLTTAAAAGAYQPLSETLTNLTGVTVDPFGASLLELIGAEGLRSAAELGTLATQNGVISDYTLGATSS